MFSVNQIVRGHKCGTFVVLGFFVRSGERFAQLKEVNPSDYTQTAPGELCLPVSMLREVA